MRASAIGKAKAAGQVHRGGQLTSEARLVHHLAEQILHWRVGPNRFLTQGRCWVRKSRFNPLERLDHAFRLLDESGSGRYSIGFSGGRFRVEIELDGAVGERCQRVYDARECRLVPRPGPAGREPVEKRMPRNTSAVPGVGRLRGEAVWATGGFGAPK